jgi:hypothetical protein
MKSAIEIFARVKIVRHNAMSGSPARGRCRMPNTTT